MIKVCHAGTYASFPANGRGSLGIGIAHYEGRQVEASNEETSQVEGLSAQILTEARGMIAHLPLPYSAVATSSVKFSHIIVREPSTGNPKIFKMLALPFGSIKSVHSFLRVAHSLWFLATCALDVLWTNYFDDFVCCCPKSESKHLSMTVHAFFHILGWTFAEAGSKAIDFDGVCKALGVTTDVSLMHQGKVLVDNTESRKRELGEFIDHVVKTKKLSSADALKLRGRMQFTSGQLFGRVAKTCLAKVTNHAYRSGSTEVSESLISSLVLFKTFLLAQKPRMAPTPVMNWMMLECRQDLEES